MSLTRFEFLSFGHSYYLNKTNELYEADSGKREKMQSHKRLAMIALVLAFFLATMPSTTPRV
jgi:hypothetical protein